MAAGRLESGRAGVGERLGFGLLRTGGDQGVEKLDRFLVTEAQARFVARHAVDFRSGIAPGDTEEHIRHVTLVAGAVVGGVEFMEQVAGGVGEGMLLESELAIEIEQSGFGAD